MSIMRKKSKDGLVSKVLKISPNLILKDEGGVYVPFCNFRYHRGIVKDTIACERRACRHYRKLYVPPHS